MGGYKFIDIYVYMLPLGDEVYNYIFRYLLLLGEMGEKREKTNNDEKNMHCVVLHVLVKF